MANWRILLIQALHSLGILLMKSMIHKQITVLVVLLSLMGQAFATTSICMMNMTNSGNETFNNISASSSPCHDAKNSGAGDIEATFLEGDKVSDSLKNTCCDQTSGSSSTDFELTDSSCSCLDSGCSVSSIPFSNAVNQSHSSSDSVIIYSNSRFISQIRSALFRPPIV